ncbi:MAG: hypothetical protein Q9227_004569 [Pyrenula ochraceoflavens]
MGAGDKIKDLAYGEKKHGGCEIEHGFSFTKYAKDEDGFKNEEEEEADEGKEEVDGIEGVVAVVSPVAAIPEACPRKASIKRDVADADENSGSAAKNQAKADSGSIIEELETHKGIEK